MFEPCLCGALDCRACRGSDAYDPDIEADDQRDDYAMRALVDELFNEVICGRMTPKEAGDQLDAAGVPLEVQRRVLIGCHEGACSMKYLPPRINAPAAPDGSARRQCRLEGSVGTLALVCAIGFGLVAATPGELYRSAPATLHPAPAGSAAPGIALQIPPCTGAGKDCTEVEPDGTVTVLPRTGPQPAPLPQVQHQANTVPEPGTLALIGAGLAGLLWRSRS